MKKSQKRGLSNIDLKKLKKNVGKQMVEDLKKVPEISFGKIESKLADGSFFDIGDNHTEGHFLGSRDSDDMYAGTYQASWMRYSANAAGTASLKSLTELNVSGNVSARLDLINGGGAIEGMLPSKNGYSLIIEDREKDKLDLGSWRLDLKIALTGSVGAQFILGAGAEVNVKSFMNKFNVSGQKNSIKFKKKNKQGISSSNIKQGAASGEATADLFAGAKGDVDVSGNAQWKNPEKDLKWLTFGGVSWGVGVSAGIGLSGNISVGLDKLGRFCLSCKWNVTVGFGVSSRYMVVVGLPTIGEFFLYLYNASKRSKFDFEKYLDEDVLKYYKYILYTFFLPTPIVAI